MKAVSALAFVSSVVLLAGCEPHIKSLESNASAMTPNPQAGGKTVDPYTFGGIAAASGGVKPTASYASSPANGASAVPAPAAPAKKPAPKGAKPKAQAAKTDSKPPIG